MTGAENTRRAQRGATLNYCANFSKSPLFIAGRSGGAFSTDLTRGARGALSATYLTPLFGKDPNAIPKRAQKAAMPALDASKLSPAPPSLGLALAALLTAAAGLVGIAQIILYAALAAGAVPLWLG